MLRGHCRQAAEHITDIRERLNPVTLAGDDEGVDDRGALAGVGVTDEQPIFLTDGRGADGVFDEVVVEPGLAVLEVGGQRRPVIEQIGAGLAEAGLGQHLRLQRDGEAAQQ